MGSLFPNTTLPPINYTADRRQAMECTKPTGQYVFRGAICFPSRPLYRLCPSLCLSGCANFWDNTGRAGIGQEIIYMPDEENSISLTIPWIVCPHPQLAFRNSTSSGCTSTIIPAVAPVSIQISLLPSHQSHPNPHQAICTSCRRDPVDQLTTNN